MKNEIYAIYDTAAECYLQFLPFQNDSIARMAFEQSFKYKRINIPLIYDYPNVYQVMKIATFDDNKGTFENVVPELFLNFGSLTVEAVIES